MAELRTVPAAVTELESCNLRRRRVAGAAGLSWLRGVLQITVNITGAVTKSEFEKVLKQLGQAAPDVTGFRKKKGGALFCCSVLDA